MTTTAKLGHLFVIEPAGKLVEKQQKRIGGDCALTLLRPSDKRSATSAL
jgi:hypothetical protein